jgi:hypothetical protein
MLPGIPQEPMLNSSVNSFGASLISDNNFEGFRARLLHYAKAVLAGGFFDRSFAASGFCIVALPF